MTLRVSNYQLESDLDSIRNSSNVLIRGAKKTQGQIYCKNPQKQSSDRERAFAIQIMIFPENVLPPDLLLFLFEIIGDTRVSGNRK